jgi:hypothetical protein
MSLQFTAPYRRVAGVGCVWSSSPDVDAVLATERAETSARAATAAAASAPPPPPPPAPPAASTTNSARELQAMRRMNVGPRYSPAERFAEPQTAAQGVGWKAARTST